MAARYTILLLAALLLADAAREVDIRSTGFPRTSTRFTRAVVTGDINEAVPTGRHGLFTAKREALTVAGTRKVRYEHTHMGIPVYGSVLTAEHHTNGTLTGHWQGHMFTGIQINSTMAVLQPVDALLVLRRAFAHDLINPSRIVFSNEQTELHIYVGVNGKEHLAYQTSYVVEQSRDYSLFEWLARRFQWIASWRRLTGIPARPTGFVDAMTGELLATWDGLSHVRKDWVTGVGGNTRSGMRVIKPVKVTKSDDGSICELATGRVQVQNMHIAPNIEFFPYMFPCDQAMSQTYDYFNGGYSASNEAMYYADKVYDMFFEYTGDYGPLRGNTLKVRVHYGMCYANANWDGTYVNIGDGDSNNFPFTSGDAIAHEFAHGFTQLHSHLENRYMPGAINEAFSDMAGEALEYFLTKTNDFLVGAEIMKRGGAMRDMCTPSVDGLSIDNAISYFRNDLKDVHLSAGVYNKAFCCLSKAGTWNTAKAFKVFAHANQNYWHSTLTFDRGACGVMAAARDLGYPVNDVIYCFATVKVICEF